MYTTLSKITAACSGALSSSCGCLQFTSAPAAMSVRSSRHWSSVVATLLYSSCSVVSRGRAVRTSTESPARASQ